MKFLDLLNKPVNLRWRSTAGNGPDIAAAQAAQTASGAEDTRAATAERTAVTNAPARARTEVRADTGAGAHAGSQTAAPAHSAHATGDRSATSDAGRSALLSQQLDEAALLFATEQPAAAIALLESALPASSPQRTETERRGWQMLLELYAYQREQAGFDRAALAYAQRFEASPPQWRPPPTEPIPHAQGTAGAAPLLLSLRENLDATAQAMLEQWQQRSAAASALLLELGSVSAVDLAGCHLLLDLLAHWQQRGVRVQLQRCDPLLAQLHALIQSGRRDEDDAGWLLLIELLRLAGDVERYEDACLAYSLTYEMSPPAAPPPANPGRHPASTPIAASARDPASLRVSTGAAFAMPEVITMPVEPLLFALRAHVRETGPGTPVLVLDARRLQRIDFHAAAALQASLAELAAGKPVEWQGVSYLVSTLLQLTCGSTAPGIINRQP